jgi:serine/threonine protein kinase
MAEYEYLSQGLHGCTFINKEKTKITKIVGITKYLNSIQVQNELDINMYIKKMTLERPDLKLDDHFCTIESFQEVTKDDPLVKLCTIEYTDKIYKIEMPYCGITNFKYTKKLFEKFSDTENINNRSLNINNRSLNIAIKLAESINLLNYLDIIHGDLHENNFLIDDRNENDIKVRIIDFTFSSITSLYDKLTFQKYLQNDYHLYYLISLDKFNPFHEKDQNKKIIKKLEEHGTNVKYMLIYVNIYNFLKFLVMIAIANILILLVVIAIVIFIEIINYLIKYYKNKKTKSKIQLI